MKRIRELRKALDSGLLCAKELLSASLYGLSGEPGLCAQVGSEDAFAQAKRADELIALKSARDLTGIPVCVDVSIRKEVPATIYKKLLGYGAVIAAQIPSDVSAGRNGVAVAVAQGYAAGGYTNSADLTAMKDAKERGLCLLKPSRGVISRYGIAPFAPSFDTVAVVSHSADDLGILMDAVTDYDPRDPLMVQPNCYGYSEKIGTPLSGLTVGVLSEQKELPAVKRALGQLSKAGVSCKWIEKAVAEDCKDVYNLILTAEHRLTKAQEGLPSEAAYARASQMDAELSELFSGSCDMVIIEADESALGENAMILPVVSGHPAFMQGSLVCIGKMYDEETIIAVMAALEEGE